ncbi:conserved hypothetical protein [Vibrio chagasii]|nr:conserved hypothetical protein [Vibrio chagasii]CAH7303421.1 conserved hypothetical protein [Vibrio chagasii]
MTDFFEKSQFVNVSRISESGWWIENTREYVSEGTTLGPDFTQNIYFPSKEGMIAQYDRLKDEWSVEFEDMTLKPYWDKNGQRFVIGEPNGVYPNWAVKHEPPEYNNENHTVLYSEEVGWKINEIQIGRSYYDEWGNEGLVSEVNFELPEECSWQVPPEPEPGFAVRWVSGEWLQLIDNRGKMAFAKDRDNTDHEDYRVEDLVDLPATHTLLEPGYYDSWVNDEIGWQYDQGRHHPFKVEREKAWRDRELIKVINRIDQYEKDQSYPREFRTSPIQSEADFLKLLEDRKVLSDYPDAALFPFGERPILSGLAN